MQGRKQNRPMDGETEHSYDLFISFAEADGWWVEGYLLYALEEAGVRCHSEAAFALGAPRLLEFERAIQQSQCTLLVLSPSYLSEGSNQFIDLLAQSYDLERSTWRVIPLILRPVKLPPRLGMLIPLDATDSEGWSKVVERLCLELQRPAPAPAPRLECPYPGMEPFRAQDACFFYGREAKIDDMLQRLRHQRFLVVIGDSGSGKSSLISAGLLPKLNESTSFPPGFWLLRTMRPGSQPVQTLSQVVGADLSQPAQAISDLLAAHPPAQRLLLIIDPFEELFTQASREDQSQFIAVLQALRASESSALVIALRGDFFYTDLKDSDLWPVALSERLEIDPLHGAALRDAIVKPAARVGVYLEPALVEVLLKDAAGERGVLPLVQETMRQLWDKMEGRLILLRAYEQLGAGERSGLAGAVVTKANATMDALAQRSPRHETIARRIFVRLVQYGEGRPDTRRQQPESALRSWDDDPQVFDQTLQHLADNRLLTLSGEKEDKDRKVDIAHEALFTEWPALKEQVREWRQPEQMRRKLEGWAADWANRNCDPKALLNVVELGQAEEWLRSPVAGKLGYSKATQALVEASRLAIEEERRDKETTRQRELTAKLEAKHAQDLADAATETAGRLRRRAIALGLALVVVFVLAMVAGWLFNEARIARQAAEDAERVATAGELAAQALLELVQREDPSGSRALLLARQSVLTTWQADRTVQPISIAALSRAVLDSPWRATLEGHGDRVTSVAFDPDGERIAVADWDGILRVWDWNSGRVLLTLSKVPYAVATFSPEGDRIVAGGAGGIAHILDAASGRELAELSGHTGTVWSASFSQDGTRVVTASTDGTARIWDAASGDPLQVFQLRRGEAGGDYYAAFSPDRQRVVTGGADGVARIWDEATGNEVRRLTGHTEPINAVAFGPDGRRVVTASSDRTARIWDAITGDELLQFGGTDMLWSVSFSPKGDRIVTGDKDGRVRIWDATSGETLQPAASGAWQPLTGHAGTVWSVAYSLDGARIASGGEDGTVRIWDAGNGDELLELGIHIGWVLSAAFSPATPGAAVASGERIVTADGEGMARIWDAATGEELLQFGGAMVIPMRSATFSPDGKRTVTLSGDNPDKVVGPLIWDATTGELVLELIGHTDLVWAAAYSPDGTEIVTASGDGTARTWNATTGRELLQITGHTGAVMCAAFSPAGDRIVTAGTDDTVRIWDSVSQEEMLRLKGETADVTSVAFSPDGQYLVTGHLGGTASIWDATDGHEFRRLSGHTDSVRSAQFSPDGVRVVTASDDGTARIWEAATGRELLRLSGHSGKLTTAAFSPDGRRVVTASEDGTARTWLTDVEELLALAQSRVQRDPPEFTPEERCRFLHECE